MFHTGIQGIIALPPDSPVPSNSVLPPKPAHLVNQATSSFRQKKPPLPSPPQSPPAIAPKPSQEVSFHSCTCK